MASKQTTRLGKAPEEGIKAPVIVVSLDDISLSGLPIISGIQLVEGDRVLVKGQFDQTENGIYNAAVGTWDRSTDWNKNNDVINGQLVVDSNNKNIWITCIPDDFDMNVSIVTFILLVRFNDSEQDYRLVTEDVDDADDYRLVNEIVDITDDYGSI